MIEIEIKPWQAMVVHAERMYPNECCGAMLGRRQGEKKVVTEAILLENVYEGGKNTRYELRSEDLQKADNEARSRGLELIGIFHSHPDSAAYFSETDLRNSCPWYSFVVLSIQRSRFDHANSFLPDMDQMKAEEEELIWPKF